MADDETPDASAGETSHDIFSEDETPESETPDVDEGVDEEEQTDEEVPEEEEEEPLEEPEDDEAIEEVARTSFANINKDFPGLFKKYPDLRNVIGREQRFSTIYGTVEEAEEAASKAQAIDYIDTAIDSGDFQTVISSMGEGTLVDFADSVLPTLMRMNENLYGRAIAPVIAQTLRSALKNAEKVGGELGKNQANAVKVLAQFIFGQQEIPAYNFKQLKDATVSKKELELNQREHSIEYTAYKQFEDSVHSSAKSFVRKEIEKGLDPKGEMAEFTREALVREIERELGQTLAGNENFQSQNNALWARARKTGYSKDARTRIIAAYLGRVRAVLGPIRQKARARALGRRLPKANPAQHKRIGATSPSGNSRTKSENLDPRKIDWSKTSTRDLFGDKVTLRGK